MQDLVNGVANPNDTVGGIDTTYSKPPSTFFSGELLRKPRSSFAKRWWGLALVVALFLPAQPDSTFRPVALFQ